MTFWETRTKEELIFTFLKKTNRFWKESLGDSDTSVPISWNEVIVCKWWNYSTPNSKHRFSKSKCLWICVLVFWIYIVVFFKDFFEILPVLCEIKYFNVHHRYNVENLLSVPVIKGPGDIILKTKNWINFASMAGFQEACYQKISKNDWKNLTISYMHKVYSVKLPLVWQWYYQNFCYQNSAILVSVFCIKM